MGLWLTTSHRLFNPHDPGHGLMHFRLTQALFCGHSELMVHCGLQLGGTPSNVGKQEQTA